MRDFDLRFYVPRWHDRLLDLLGDESPEVPEIAGGYVLGTSDGTKFTYPWGVSPVFYIGKAQNLRKRLGEHQRYIQSAIHDHDEDWFWPKYQYGAAFGASVAWYTIRGRQRPGDLEADLVEKFYEVYGAIPVGNHSWPSRLADRMRGSG